MTQPLPDRRDWIDEAVFKASEIHAAQQERLAERVAESWLPHPLRWLVGHPRLLRFAYRLRPGWRPLMYVSTDDGSTAYCARMKDGTMAVLEITTTGQGWR